MKAFLIEAPFDTFSGKTARTTLAHELIVDITLCCLRRGGDSFHYSVTWANPGEEPGGPWNEDLAVPHVVQLHTAGRLREWLLQSIDPNAAGGGDVRSIATCRAITFGYDGQAFLLLRHDDPPPVSPDVHLAVVTERPDLLRNADYFDGWIRNRPDAVNIS